MRMRAVGVLLGSLVGVSACGSSGGTNGTTVVGHDAGGGGAQHDDGGVDATETLHDGGGHEGHADARRDAPHHVTGDGAYDAGVTTPALDAAVNVWTFSTIPGAACLDGSETGFAVNPAATPTDDLLIFLEGGGACWDGESCWGPVSSAFYVATGYTSVEFATDPQVDLYVLDRTNAENPFSGMNMAFIPYCTGDVLAGNNVTTLSYLGMSHDTHFVGWNNMTVFLRSIAATFPNAKNVWLAGDSAGGFGTALNWDHVQGELPGSTVQILDDSGQPIAPAAGRWPMWVTTWNLQLPSACPGCKTDPGAFVAYFSAKYPNQRFGLISYQEDIVISPFMDISLTQFNTELLALASDMDMTWPNGHYYIIPTPPGGHVGLLAPTSEMQTWITDMVTGAPSWASEKP